MMLRSGLCRPVKHLPVQKGELCWTATVFRLVTTKYTYPETIA